MSKLIDNSGSLVDADSGSAGESTLVWSIGPHTFSGGTTQNIPIDPAWRRLDLNVMIVGGSLLMPDGNAHMPGNGAFKWIKGDHSVEQWLVHFDGSTHQWFDAGDQDVTALRASLLRMETSHAPKWMGDVQVSFHPASGGNQSRTGSIWLDEESGHMSVGCYRAESGQFSATLYGRR